MNIKHVNNNLWTKLALASYTSSVVIGLFGRSRTNYSNDFTYNKYHFGVLMNLVSGFGLFLSAKVPTPWHSGLCFIATIGLTSFPGYYEGYKDMRNEHYEGSSAGKRKLGFYFMLLGFGIIMAKHRKLRAITNQSMGGKKY